MRVQNYKNNIKYKIKSAKIYNKSSKIVNFAR